MKLLLTSAGLTNQAISNSLLKLVNKPFANVKLMFIPTAANIEAGGKEWLIDNFVQCQKLGLAEIDIVDISVLPQERWLPRLEKADILFFGGGNAYYLMYWLGKSGLKKLMPELLKTRVYAGISAGSMVTTTNFHPTFNHDIGLYNEEDLKQDIIKNGLSLVDFHVIPHLNSRYFKKVRITNIEKYAKETTETIYAIDDQTAIEVIDSKMITIISEGEWKKFH